MKNVIFTKIGLTNFGCYIEPFQMDIISGKMTMISGPNGTGKTTIFDSISFTLYGVTSKGLRGKDVVNNKTEKDCHTFVEFTIDDVPFRADRYYAHTRLKNAAILKRNGVPYKNGPTEVTNEIEKILMPLKLFNNSIMFGQKVKTFFTDLKDTEQKEIFRKILKLGDYVLYHKRTGELIKEIDQLLTDNNNQLSINNNMIENYNREIDLILEEKKEFEKSKVEKISEYNDQIGLINRKIELYKSDLVKYENSENELKKVDTILNEYQNKLKGLEIQFKNIVEQIQNKAKNKQLEMSNKASKMESEETNKFNIILNDLNGKINKLDSDFKLNQAETDKKKALINSDIKSLMTSIDNMREEIEKFEGSVVNAAISKCPTCNQEIDGKVIDNLKIYIKSLYEKIYKNKNEIEQKKLENNNIDQNIDKLRLIYKEDKFKLCNQKEKKNTEFRNNIDNIKNKLNDVFGKLKSAVMMKVKEQTENIRNEKNKIDKDIDEFEQQRKNAENNYEKYKELKKSITDFEFRVRNYNELIKSKKEEEFDNSRILLYKDKIDSDLLNIDKIKEDRLKIKRRFDILSVWKDGFSKSGIESMLIDESIPFMNEQVNKYLEQISFGRYSLTFDTVKQMGGKDEYRDKIHLNVLDNVTLSDSREKFSGGQTRILDISVILTLCDLQNHIQNVKFNLLLFDEIFDSLDDENTIKVSALLKSLTKDRSIYIISHRHIDNIDVDEELKFMG